MKISFVVMLLGIGTSCSDNPPPKQIPTDRNIAGSMIVGRWKTTDAEIVPFGHISYCENLTLNSIFEFKNDGKLKVYINEQTSIPCNGDQAYNLDDRTLDITENDMIFNYDVTKLTMDSLILNIKHLPIDMLRKMDISQKQLQHIKKEGFDLTLIKTD